jgi:hypothetical protein
MKRACLVLAFVFVLGMLIIPMSAIAGEIVYSNVTNYEWAYFDQSANSEMGDYLFLTHGGILDSLTFGVYNQSDYTTVTDITVKFYNPIDYYNRTFEPPISLVYDDYSLGPWVNTPFFTNISSQQLINLSDKVLVTLTFSNLRDVTGAPVNVTLGQFLYDPPTVGSSWDDFYLDGGWYWFGGPPYVANFYYEVDVVPEPTSLILLATGLGALGLVSWRRKK